MLLSFLIDQLQQHACQLYRAVRRKVRVQKVMLGANALCASTR